MIWIDTSVPKPVAEALAKVRGYILYVGDRYPFELNKDQIWLADAGKESGLVILRDKKVRTRPGERRVIIENGVGVFVLTQNRNPNKWDYLRLIVGALDEIEEKFASTPRPFIWTIDLHGVFHEYAVRLPKEPA